jgi:hypothetical protein
MNRKIFNKKYLLLVFIFFSKNVFAQVYQPIHHYTSQNGLPSNLVFELLQDNNGASSFDGKYFRNYTFKVGLPSNDVVAC